MNRRQPLRLRDLRPADNLLAVFEDCHNYIYANEGLLKERVFHEVVKLLLVKLADEQRGDDKPARFAIAPADERAVAAGDGAGFVARFNRLYAAVRREHPHLLANDPDLTLKPATLAWLVARLQGVSLSRTAGDVKGAAFQTFVYRNQRGDRGEYFTPQPIVELAVRMLDPCPGERLIDPACGSGGFLLEAIAHVRRAAGKKRVDIPDYVRNCVRGIEFNPHVARAAAVRLAFEGGKGDEVLCRNALLPAADLAGTFDVLLTNPPFGARGKVEDAATLAAFDLARRWIQTAGGDWRPSDARLAGQSPEILFIERSLELLKPGGRMAIVLPDGLLQNASCGYLRSWLRTKAELLAVISVPQEAFVPYGTGVKTSVLFLRKRPCPVARRSFMGRLRRIGYDVKGQAVWQRDGDGAPMRDAAGQPIADSDVPHLLDAYARFHGGKLRAETDDAFLAPRGELAARLDVEHYLPSDRRLIDGLAAAGAQPLADLATIIAEADDFRDGGGEEIRYVAISDIHAPTAEIIRQQRIKAHEAPSRARYRLRTGDILTAISGASTGTPQHATALVTTDEDGAICSNGLAVLRDVRGIDPAFLLCYLRSDAFLRQVRRLLTGHAIPAISHADLATVLVPIPPAAEQSRIAGRFAQVGTLRRELRQATAGIDTELTSILANHIAAD